MQLPNLYLREKKSLKTFKSGPGQKDEPQSFSRYTPIPILKD